AMRKDERHTPPGGRTSIYEMNAFPHEVVEGVEFSFPSAPIELIDPVTHEPPQPFQFGALLPLDSWYLVWPSRTPKSRTQVFEHFLRNMNPKGLHRPICPQSE